MAGEPLSVLARLVSTRRRQNSNPAGPQVVDRGLHSRTKSGRRLSPHKVQLAEPTGAWYTLCNSPTQPHSLLSGLLFLPATSTSSQSPCGWPGCLLNQDTARTGLQTSTFSHELRISRLPWMIMASPSDRRTQDVTIRCLCMDITLCLYTHLAWS